MTDSEERPIGAAQDTLFTAMRGARSAYEAAAVAALFQSTSEDRVRALAQRLESYISVNLPIAIDRRSTLQDYRTNPYVLMTCGNLTRLEDPHDFATFVVNNKLYMGLETSFGKSVESIVMGGYPIGSLDSSKWEEPTEKRAEFAELAGLSRENKARRRGASVWREIDKSVIVGDRRYLLSIKSGPNTINDTQVNAMKDAIRDQHKAWLTQSIKSHGITGLDVVLGLTYGTPRTTNNKDNQLIAKLLECGFTEDSRAPRGTLTDEETGTIRVYRVVGADYWSFVAAPQDPSTAPFAFLEVLLALAIALKEVAREKTIEEGLNARLAMLATAIGSLQFPVASLPRWVKDELKEPDLFLLAVALTAFYDGGL